MRGRDSMENDQAPIESGQTQPSQTIETLPPKKPKLGGNFLLVTLGILIFLGVIFFLVVLMGQTPQSSTSNSSVALPTSSPTLTPSPTLSQEEQEVDQIDVNSTLDIDLSTLDQDVSSL